VQEGQRLAIVQPARLRNEGLDLVEHAVGAVDEPAQRLSAGRGVDALRALVEPALGTGRVVGRR